MILLLLSLLTWSSAQAFTCDTKFDDVGIPHIQTSSTEEFYYCFGLMHGQDRAWEMDYFRRVAQGRNAEVLGFSQMKSDLMMRFLNLEAKADSLWEEFPQDLKTILGHYADGVNDGFKTGKNAKEFLDLGYVPEKWEAKHSLLVLLIQSFDQTRKSFYAEYLEEKKKEDWGDKATELFNEDHMPWSNTILKEGEYIKRPVEMKTTQTSHTPIKLWSDFPTITGNESGSNNWVVSAKKSKTGNAILANDPHLELKTPLFWYWIHLKSPNEEIIGGSVPGVPVVASGTNGKVAWGLTNSYVSTADAFYASDLKSEDIVSFRPWIKIKFWFFTIPFFFKSFEQTKDGFRVLPLETQNEKKLLLRWVGFGLKAEDIAPMFGMPRVKNVTEMDSLLSKMGLPSWNYVFADTKGDIGYRVVGRSYKMTEKTPFGIQTKTMDEIRQNHFLTPDEMPHVLKPKREYVYTANNRQWPEDAAFYGGRAYSASFRGYRIDELIQKENHDVSTFKSIQCDRQVVDARFFLERILLHIKSPELTSWQFTSEDSSLALPLYRRFMDIMMESWNVNEYALWKILEKPSTVHLKEMREFYKLAQKEVKKRTWGELHRLNFPHLSKNKDWEFSPEIAAPGDTHTVDPGTATWNPSRKLYEQTTGASMRMIVELSERPKVELVLPGLNREYTEKSAANPWMSWKACQYTKISF